MAIIPTVGRKTWSMRLLIGGMYIILSIGSVTMVYPFLVMLSTAVKSSVDVNDYRVVPKYLYDNGALFGKYAEMKFAGDIDQINGYYRADFAKLENVTAPKNGPLTAGETALVRDWADFGKTLAMSYKQANYGQIPGTSHCPSRLLDAYRASLRKQFNNDIDALNRLYLEENVGFETVFTPFERTAQREWQPERTAKMQEWLKFEQTLPTDYLRVVGCDHLYATFLKENKYDAEIKALNAAYGTHYKSFYDVHFSPGVPANPKERPDWAEFAQTMLPFRSMKVTEEAGPAYRQFLSKRYLGRISEINRIYKTHYASFDQIPLPKAQPQEGTPLTDWMEFISKACPVTAIRATNAENLFRDYVLVKYGSLDAANKAYGLNLKSVVELAAPNDLADWGYVLENRRFLRKHFLGRNYATVLGYMLLHGRAVFNTIIFCTAVVLTHLIVNPLCAYALSRYNLKYAYRVLLFLLATMAFPAEVTAIPNFLLLKKLHLLNTFWALILPGMASGYAIFLLKGFFDSLPKELYEAGIIDGASEPRMFWQITMPLSKPIFAVIALGSFTAAYGAFMFAFLVCQNQKMWTMMVWLYEMQILAPKYITMSALTLTALPTLLIFVFCQNIIMRGIILPSFK
jgi:ABC-type glycerol-3-phosphate transport system permease component